MYVPTQRDCGIAGRFDSRKSDDSVNALGQTEEELARVSEKVLAGASEAGRERRGDAKDVQHDLYAAARIRKVAWKNAYHDIEFAVASQRPARADAFGRTMNVRLHWKR